jgi:hypothetical protein
MMKRSILAAAASLLLVTACATPTPYQPLQIRGGTSGGFSETRVSSDRYRVTFEGNISTDRETVERYLLYRAAELTRDEGYDWFAMADRDTERQVREYIVADDPFGYGYWQPSWYYLGRGRWAMIPRADPFYRQTYERRTVDKYRATAEILLGKGRKPANDVAAFDARDVIANLGPSIKRPEAAA